MEVNVSGFWDEVYRDNAPVLLGLLRRYVKDLDTAQDLLQEVFISAIDKYDTFSGKGSFEGWLYRIAVNTALMYYRNEKKMLTCTQEQYLLSGMNEDDTEIEQTASAKFVIESAEFSSEELLSAIDRLPEHHKLVFNMYVMDNFSHKQIAAELNISQGTSKSHLARARKKIQQFLYEDAMNKKNKKDRRIASAILLLFPCREHYVDKLFRNGLSNFKISPTGGTDFITTAIRQKGVTGFNNSNIQGFNKSIFKSGNKRINNNLNNGSAFWGDKLSYFTACCGTVAITGTVCWLTMSVNSPLNRYDNNIDSEIIVNDTVINSSDYIDIEEIENFNNSDAPSESFTIETSEDKKSNYQDNSNINEKVNTEEDNVIEKPSAPVVIKKQVIQHQTVIVRDTVIIEE